MRWISSAGPRQYGTSKIRTSPPTSARELAGARRRWSAASARCRTGPGAARTCRRPRPSRAPRSARPSGSRRRAVQASRTRARRARFGLPGRSGIGAAIGDEQRVERVDEVRVVGLVLEDVDRRPEAVSTSTNASCSRRASVEVARVQEPVGRVVEGARRTPGPGASRGRRGAARTCSARRSAGSWRSPDEDSRRPLGRTVPPRHGRDDGPSGPAEARRATLSP